jgi:hypothetical protein
MQYFSSIAALAMKFLLTRVCLLTSENAYPRINEKILLSYKLERAFPHGYFVAMPDRPVGMVISKSLDMWERKALKKAMAVYQMSRYCNVKKIIAPVDFSLPPLSLEPICRFI